MSVHAMAWAIRQRAPSPGCKLLLILLADRANEDNACWPSIKRLEDESGLSERGVHKCLVQLVAADLLSVDSRKHSNGRCATNVFRLQMGETPTPNSVHPAIRTGALSAPTEGELSAPEPSEEEPRKKDSLRDAGAPKAVAVVPLCLPAVIPAEPAEPDAPRPPSIRAALFRDGVPILRALIGKSDSQCRTMLGSLLKAAADDAARVYILIREAEDLSPADPQAWLYAATKRGGRSGAPRRENTGARLRRELGLDAHLDSLFADPAATGVLLQ